VENSHQPVNWIYSDSSLLIVMMNRDSSSPSSPRENLPEAPEPAESLPSAHGNPVDSLSEANTPASTSLALPGPTLPKNIEAQSPSIVHCAKLIQQNTQYALVEFLAEGGESYLFIGVKDSQEYVIKCFKEPPVESLFCDSQDIRSYFREAAISDQIAHLSIPRVTEVIRLQDGTRMPKIALIRPKIEGLSLKEIIQNGGYQTPEDLIELLLQMADILKFLHSNTDNRTGTQIIHSDIKPGNIIVLPNGGLQLIDFSASRQIKPGHSFAHTVVLRGTPDYCPPEQFGGAGVPASDIYSLGITAVECLLGYIPEELKNNWKRESPYRLPHQPRIPREFKNVLEKMIHPLKEERFQSADELLRDLLRASEEMNNHSNSWLPRLSSLLGWEVAPSTKTLKEKPALNDASSSAPHELNSGHTKAGTPKMNSYSLEYTQGLYKSFSENITVRMSRKSNKESIWQNSEELDLSDLGSDFKDSRSKKAFPLPMLKDYIWRAPAFELEGLFAFLTQYTKAESGYAEALEMLNDRLANHAQELSYKEFRTVFQDSVPRGICGLSKAVSRRMLVPSIPYPKFARLINVIEHLDGRAVGSEFVSNFLLDALSLGRFEVIDDAEIDTQGIICGAVTSLLETEKIRSRSIAMKVKSKLGTSLYGFAGKIPPKIEMKFLR
jgi:serine/threonine protein kinase